jgi:hypothetical protein
VEEASYETIENLERRQRVRIVAYQCGSMRENQGHGMIADARRANTAATHTACHLYRRPGDLLGSQVISAQRQHTTLQPRNTQDGAATFPDDFHQIPIRRGADARWNAGLDDQINFKHSRSLPPTTHERWDEKSSSVIPGGVTPPVADLLSRIR